MKPFLAAGLLAASVAAMPGLAASQHVDRGPGPSMSADDIKAMAAHMEMTPLRPSNRADSLRAATVVTKLRAGIAKYRDVRVAVDDGFRQFAPQLKNQSVYHFTNYRWGFENAFRFNAAKPTSLLYNKDAAGNFVLVGAMYTAPKRHSPDKLDRRIPLSVAQWHKHINWCLPPKGEDSRWLDRRNGRPVFGPLGVSSRTECESAGGRFEKQVFGWMVHANVFAGDDPKVIWGDEHRMSGDEMMEHRH